MREIDPAVLAEIRRAAFELRADDPRQAVRILRRAAARGGEAEVLARGALGEIYLEELGDLDGAEHEYRAVLQLAPDLAAAELGLSRTLREQGRTAEALAAIDRAIESLVREAESFRDRKAQGEPVPAGAEEVVLTLLETALDRADLARDLGDAAESTPPRDEAPPAGATPSPPASTLPGPSDIGRRIEEIAQWAERERLFDALRDEGDDPDEDWARFHALRARLRGGDLVQLNLGR